jgi:hypothetical protein
VRGNAEKALKNLTTETRGWTQIINKKKNFTAENAEIAETLTF